MGTLIRANDRDAWMKMRQVLAHIRWVYLTGISNETYCLHNQGRQKYETGLRTGLDADEIDWGLRAGRFRASALPIANVALWWKAVIRVERLFDPIGSREGGPNCERCR